MTKDRMTSLLRVLEQRGEKQELDNAYDNLALDMDHDAIYMGHFFNRILEIREWIDKIEGNVDAIRTLHSQLLSSPRADVRVKSELQARTETIKELAKRINQNLKELEKKIEEEELSRSEEESNHEEHWSEAGLRIRKTQYSTTTYLYVQAMTAFNKAQYEYRDRCYDRIHRVISIAEADISNEKLEEILEKGDYGAIFNGDIILETMDVQRALADVQMRHQELISLEKTISELKDLFQDLAFLINKQGELIDNIEKHVLEAKDHVEVGKIKTKAAVVMNRKYRKKKIILIIIGIIILAAIITALVFYFKPSSSTSNSSSKSDQKS